MEGPLYPVEIGQVDTTDMRVDDSTAVAYVENLPQKHAGGRPTDYSEEIVTKAQEYIDSCEDEEYDYHKTRGDKSDSYEYKVKVKLPTIEGLAFFLRIDKTTIYEWEKKYPKFSNVINDLRSKQANMLINKGLSGDYNPTIAKVLLTKHGYREGLDQTTNDKDLPASDYSNEQYERIIRARAEKLNNPESSQGGTN